MTRAPIQAAGDPDGIPIPVDVPGRGVIEFRFRTSIGVNLLKTLAAIQGADRTDRRAGVDSIVLIANHLDRAAMGPNADLWRELVESDEISAPALAQVFKAIREDASPLDPTPQPSSPDGSSPTGSPSTAGAAAEGSMPPPSATTDS